MIFKYISKNIYFSGIACEQNAADRNEDYRKGYRSSRRMLTKTNLYAK